MNRRHPCPLLPLGAVALLSACAAGGEFPSLAPRPVEQADRATPEPEPSGEATDAVDPQLAARLAALVADARRGQTAFEAILAGAASAVAGAGGAGSESWIVAQQAISRLESERAPTVIALAELDQLAIAHAGTAALPTVVTARDAARLLAEAQGQRIDALRGQLSPI